jgi:sulfoxide reductase heme-binding subunit YedZ
MVLSTSQKRPPENTHPAGVRRSSAPLWRWAIIFVHLAALAPLALLLLAWTGGRLGANPIREITLRTGRYALTLLVLSLACTPLHLLTGLAPIRRLRKPLGLYAFLYVTLHLLTYLGLDFRFNLAFLWPEVTQQPFIQVGLLAFLALLPLAITSTRGWIARLGKNWKRLHRLVYLAAALAVLHFFWLVKSDWRRPAVAALALSLLLLARLPPLRKLWAKLRKRIQQ